MNQNVFINEKFCFCKNTIISKLSNNKKVKQGQLWNEQRKCGVKFFT